VRGDFADVVHATGVTEPAILDDRDIDIDDVAFLQDPVAGDAVADLLVDGGADRFGEPLVTQGSWNAFLNIHDVVVAQGVQFLGGDAGNDIFCDHVQNLGRETTSDSHFGDLLWRFEGDGHSFGRSKDTGPIVYNAGPDRVIKTG